MLGPRVLAAWIVQYSRDQFRVHVFGDLTQLAFAQTNHKTISVVVGQPGFGLVVASGFDYNVVSFSNEALRVGPDPVDNHGTQRPQKFVEDSLLAIVRPRPLGIAAGGPAKILRHAVKKRFG